MSNNRNCLLSFNCQIMTGLDYNYCPNKYTCEEIAKQIQEDLEEEDYIELPSCHLFYKYNLDYKCWEFKEFIHFPEVAKNLGFEKPIKLPYQYFELDVVVPELDIKKINGISKKYLKVSENLLDLGFAEPEVILLTRRIDDDNFEYSEVTICPPEAELYGWGRACLLSDCVEISKDKLESFLYKQVWELWNYFEEKDIYYLSYDWYIESVYKTEDYLSTYQATGCKKFMIRAYVLVSESEEANDFIKIVICEILIEKEKCIDIKSALVKINPNLLVLNLTNSKPDWIKASLIQEDLVIK